MKTKMKRILGIGLSLVIASSLVACDDEEVDSQVKDDIEIETIQTNADFDNEVYNTIEEEELHVFLKSELKMEVTFNKENKSYSLYANSDMYANDNFLTDRDLSLMHIQLEESLRETSALISDKLNDNYGIFFYSTYDLNEIIFYMENGNRVFSIYYDTIKNSYF